MSARNDGLNDNLIDVLAVWRNPIFVMGLRTRLRPRQLVVAGLLGGTFSLFLFFIVYLTTSQRGLIDHAAAARATLIPMLIVQGFVLMFLGTGAVASGIAAQREAGLVDYHRMTPMSPAAKIVGYLFGLPVREYFLFALTVPFVAFAVIAGGMSPLRIAQLYLVFFSAVLLYHMTGFVAGMVSKHPRRAGWFARMLVVALYLFLPQLAEMGFSTFAYLTVWPTFEGLVRAELGLESLSELVSAQRWRTVEFYAMTLDPMIFSLLLQGFLIATFFVIVQRKWRQPSNHAMSKPQAVVFYAVLQLLVVGSLWPLLTRPMHSGLVHLAASQLVPSAFLRIVLITHLLLSLVVALWLVHVATPDRHAFVQGVRRARKHGRDRAAPTLDAASNLWVCAALAAMTALGYATLVWLGGAHAMFGGPTPNALALVAPAWLFAAVLFYAQAIREAHGGRGLALFAFAAWVVPPLVSLVLLAAWSALLPAAYIVTPSPLGGISFAVLDLFGDGGDPLETGGHLPILTAIATVSATALALVTLRNLRRTHRQLAEEAGTPATATTPGST